jgi:hypothetical protein
MRKILEKRPGQQVYVFTTFGAVYAGVFEQVLDDDIVQLRGADGRPVFVSLSDISGVRDYDASEAR